MVQRSQAREAEFYSDMKRERSQRTSREMVQVSPSHCLSFLVSGVKWVSLSCKGADITGHFCPRSSVSSTTPIFSLGFWPHFLRVTRSGR